MNPYDLTALDSDSVLQGFDAAVLCRSRMNAVVLAYIAEMDARHLYLQQGFESMKALCMKRLHVSEDVAKKAIQVARLARQVPELFEAIADERLHLKGVRLLAPHLNAQNAHGLIAAAAHRSAAEIEIELARLYPQAEILRLDDGVSPQVVVPQLADPVGGAPGHPQVVKSEPPVARPHVAPLSPSRFTLTATLSREGHDRLRRAQDLLAHTVPNGDIAQVLERALIALVAQLERKKFGVGAKPRRRGTVRAIPAHVRKAVYERDGGRCTHVYEDDSRCDSRSKLEFDHVTPLAKGGKSTAENLRLLCRAHNQHAAEQAFGQGFVEEKKRQRRTLERKPGSC